MPQPQRSLYTGGTLNLFWADMAEHKLPGHSHVTGSVTNPLDVISHVELVRFGNDSKSLSSQWSFNIVENTVTLCLSKPAEDLSKSIVSTAYLFCSLFSPVTVPEQTPKMIFA